MAKKNGNVGSTSDLPDFEMGEAAAGVSAAAHNTLRSAVAEFEGRLGVLRESVADAEAARAALLSGVELLNRVTTQVLGIVQAVRSGPAPEENREWHQRRRSILLTGLANLAGAKSGAQATGELARVAETLLNR